MLDNALIAILATQLEAASSTAGWGYLVAQKNQPSQEGVPTAPTIFFEKLFDHEYGYPMRTDTYQPTPDNYAHVETQVVETTFQISALVPQDPTDLTIPTASDVVGYMKLFIQNSITLAAFVSSQVSMLRVSEIRNPYAIDDKDRFEASPSFDLVLQHNRTITLSVPAAVKVVGQPSPAPGDNNAGTFPV
jgi:hypothetical protein